MTESRKKTVKRIRAGNPPGDPGTAATDELAEMRGRGAAFDQLHSKLTPRASAALARLMDLTHLSKTDVTNRALQIYLFLEEEKIDGADLLLRKGDSVELVHIV